MSTSSLMNKHWNLNANIIQKVYNTFKQHVVILVTLQCIGVCTKVKNLSDMHIRGFQFNNFVSQDGITFVNLKNHLWQYV